MNLIRKSVRAALYAGACAAPFAAYADDPRRDEIVVTASPIVRPVEQTIIGVSVVDAETLARRLENSIGETLRREPGVSSSFFGPGASRPIIRGLGGDRIRVLDGGIGSIDASSTSPDHAVAVEPAMAEKIEIVRGAGMLLYGSSASGGVVNVFSGRIPTAEPDDGVDGVLRVGLSSVDDGVESAGGFDVLLGRAGGGAFVFHGEGGYREADDYNIPGFAESARLRALEEEEGEAPEEEAFGVVGNSAFETKNGSVGLSYVFDGGFFGVSVSANDTTYGVPAAHGHEEEEGEEAEEEEEEGGVSIDLRQRRFDVAGRLPLDVLIFETANLRVGYADYEHAEIEPSGEVGTLFLNTGWEGRFELIEKHTELFGGVLKGATGFQFQLRDFSAIGEEAFTPPTTSEQYGVFSLKEFETGIARFEIGGRYETTRHDLVDGSGGRRFEGFSISGGVGLQPADGVFLGVNLGRTERAPSVEELFSDGPHLATNAYEIGDPTLGLEVARNVEATLRLSAGERFAFSVNGFYTSYKDFVFEQATGAEIDELPVFQFTASDVDFRGFEAEAEAELGTVGAFDLHADASVDFVRASGDVAGDLPRIPPLKGIAGLEANSAKFDLRAEFEWAAAQERIADFELPTDGYEVVNLSASFRPMGEDSGLAVALIANNLLDEEVRLHTSFLKDIAPLPGRNVRIAVTGRF